MGKSLRQKLSAGMVTFLLALPAGARADFAEDAGMGTATVLANVVYVPTKIAYATLGGLTGGFNPLYQIGGPRSIQFSLKLNF